MFFLPLVLIYRYNYWNIYLSKRFSRSKEGEEEVLGEGTHAGVSVQDTEEGDLLIRLIKLRTVKIKKNI